ncbi:freyrasin family ranthipeptide [Paenibacillus sp. Lou8.1]
MIKQINVIAGIKEPIRSYGCREVDYCTFCDTRDYCGICDQSDFCVTSDT